MRHMLYAGFPTSFGLLALVTSVEAQTGPSFDCSIAETSAEKLICEDAELGRLDRLVANRFAAAIAVVSGLESGASDVENELRAHQRGWLAGRDECWKADSLRECIEAAYLRREGELVARWLLEEPTGISVWACGDNPANEVVTYTFDTELPSVRFERGDMIDTGAVVPTASGSKYAGSVGRSIWIKGNEAIYRDADPDGETYSCSLAKQE